ncbi:uncharacterized protein METZ01_LOCUS218969, partial [marine metagenome]
GSNIKTNWAGLIINSSIMRNNHPKEFSDNYSLFYVSYSNIDGGFGGFANIDQDPIFCGADSLNFTLDEASPCVGSGQGGTNMGAFDIGCSSELFTDNSIFPSEFVLYQNYPNPFNPITKIRYDLPINSLVSVTVYDMMGRVVKNLVNGLQTAGFKSVKWDGTNNNNQTVSAGLYIYSIYSDNYIDTKKMILLK